MDSPVVLVVQGPLLGTFFSSVLYGVFLMQTITYMYNYPHDRRIFKFVVALLCVLETAQFALSIATIEHYLIANYDNPISLGTVTTVLPVMSVFAYTIGCIVNWCFTWRIYILSEGRWIAGFLAFCATARAAISLRNCFFAFQETGYVMYLKDIHPYFLAGVSISLFVDMSIAAVTSYYLYVRQTGIRRTDDLIRRLLIYTLNSGLILFLLSFLIMITFITMQADAFLAFLQVQSEFFCISLLTSLISRKRSSDGFGPVKVEYDNADVSTMVWASGVLSHHSHPGHQMHSIITTAEDREVYSTIEPPPKAHSKVAVLGGVPAEA